ncbi:PspC domain-containing protein [Nonomuraea sp. MCN248]|uniref:PspC domain-containing protein n=1 Tax=Nonomuraea corallina TaxID=2989783 RepID=A0ABT4SKN3_9ACTN|nr:PspC domain-containing protein [Nonomuraea corallina]MDA0637505.1 PspC domain-containing protein [Nonomuraea corallina]
MTEAPPREPASPPDVLCRSGEGRFLMGVCAGLGRHTGIDPVVFRVGFVILLFGSGIGLFLYIAAFLLMKEPSGRPGLIEQWTRRDFDADAVMALLTAVLALGLGINLSTVWLDTGTLVAGLFLAVALLAAHAHGVDLLGLVRSMPERLNRRPRPTDLDEPAHGQAPRVSPYPQSAPTVAHRPPVGEPLREGAGGLAAPPPAESVAAHRDMPAPDEPATPAADDDTAIRAVQDDAAVPAYRPLAGDTGPGSREETRIGSYGEAGFGAWGEPFAPHGPYQPLDPAKRAGGHSPYDPALYGRTGPSRRQSKRPRSFIGVITMLLAMIIGGILVTVQAASPSGVQPTIVGGAVLVTIGAGLLVAAWWGRGAGLVGAGTMVAALIGVGLMFGGLPTKVGASVWLPTSLEETRQVFDVGVGDGELDLSELPLKPGSRVEVRAAVSMGSLEVIAPPEARLEVHATNQVGDIQVDRVLRGGVKVRLDKVLEPEVAPKGEPATLVLNIRGGVGDVEVRRAA